MKKMLMIIGLILASVWGNAQLSSNSKPEVFRGVIYDLKNSQPLEGAEIRIYTLSGELLTMTDENGSFNLAGITKTPFKLVISMTGYEDKVLDQVYRVNDIEYFIGLQQKGVQHLNSDF